MKLRPHRLVYALFAGLVLLASGCGMPDKPKQFSLKISRGCKRLGDAAKRFFKAIDPLGTGKQADTSEAQAAYNEMKNGLAEIQKQFESVRSPVGSAEGAELLDEFREFLKKEQAIMDGSITPIWQLVQDNRFDAAGKWAAITPLLEKAANEEAGPLRKLRKAHKAYCKAYVFEEVKP
jgi:hypothetical protein